MLLVSESTHPETFIPWAEFKATKLSQVSNDQEALEILKNCHLSSQQILQAKTRTDQRHASMTTEEYRRLLNSGGGHSGRSEIAEARADIAHLRREASWLINCAFSVIGFAAFAYFAAAFRFDRLEMRLAIGMLAGLIIFFVEVTIYIIIRAE